MSIGFPSFSQNRPAQPLRTLRFSGDSDALSEQPASDAPPLPLPGFSPTTPSEPPKKRMSWLKKLSIGSLIAVTGIGGIAGGGKIYLDKQATIAQQEAAAKNEAAKKARDYERQSELLSYMMPSLKNDQDKYELLNEMLQNSSNPKLKASIAYATKDFKGESADRYRLPILLKLAEDADRDVGAAVIHALKNVKEDQALGQILSQLFKSQKATTLLEDAVILPEVGRLQDTALKTTLLNDAIDKYIALKSGKEYYYGSYRFSDYIVGAVKTIPSDSTKIQIYKKLISLKSDDINTNIAKEAAQIKDDTAKVELLKSLIQQASGWRVRSAAMTSVQSVQDEALKVELMLSLAEKK